MNRFIHLIRPKGYNPPINWAMLYNQWLHQGFLWKLWSYEFYSKHNKDIFPKDKQS